jgi:hypothetical protein
MKNRFFFHFLKVERKEKKGEKERREKRQNELSLTIFFRSIQLMLVLQLLPLHHMLKIDKSLVVQGSIYIYI